MTAAAIEVEGLSMRYPKTPGVRDLILRPFHRDWVQALDGVTFSVPAGVLFGFLGPNGAGKTTLIKILTTLILPSAGRARVCGLDVVGADDAVKRRIGVVMSDERSFYWRLTVRQNLEFFAALHGLSAAQSARRIGELLERLHLSEKASSRFSDLSSGMKQRLAIARGMIAEPEILFCDEPTRSLDPITAAEVRSFIREQLVLGAGKTVFLTTHNLHEAEEISDRIGIINRGRILATGTVGEISARLRSRDRFRLRLRSVPDGLAEAIAAVASVVEVRRTEEELVGEAATLEIVLGDAGNAVPEIVRLAVARGAQVLECARREPTLTEIFSEIIEEDRGAGAADA